VEPTTIFALAGLAGIAVLVVSVVVLRSSGADPRTARRLAGPPELKVGALLDADRVPERPVRIAGRIRCRDPLRAPNDERLVAFHRDVAVRVGGRWRSVERVREARSFELWDHDGSLTIDPARAAEPLITIPHVWEGDPAELQEPHSSAVARLEERHGPATAARAVTRTINVTDRLLVLAQPVREDGVVRLVAPPGGFLISTLALPDAMRLLGGRRRRSAAYGVVGVAIGLILTASGAIGASLAREPPGVPPRRDHRGIDPTGCRF
jgi:hypothetical protein